MAEIKLSLGEIEEILRGALYEIYGETFKESIAEVELRFHVASNHPHCSLTEIRSNTSDNISYVTLSPMSKEK